MERKDATRDSKAHRKLSVFPAVSDLGVKMSGRGEGDKGSGRGGPKRLRKMLRSNTQGPTKPEIRRLATRKRLGEKTELQIEPWPRASSPGWRLEIGAGRMGGAPTARTLQGSLPDNFSVHWQPPKRTPDGDCAKNKDFGLNSDSPDFSVKMKWVTAKKVENQPISVKDAASWVKDGQFPLREADRGERSGLIGGGRIKIGSEISGFSVEEGTPKSAVGKKLKRVMAILEIFAGGARNACSSRGSLKSGLVIEGNILPNLFAPKWKIVDEKNKEAMIWGKIMTHVALAEYGKSLYTFFFP